MNDILNYITLTRTCLICLFLATGLISCTTITPSTPQSIPSQSKTLTSWKDREIALNRIQSWQLNGKISVQTAQDSGSATLNWIQRQHQFTISLLGPLGTGSLKLAGRPGLVTLASSDGKHYAAKDAEELLAKQWGFHVPVSHLHYWIRGLPVPGIPYNSQFDNQNRLSELVQGGVRVQYLSYANVSNIDLPDKIFITSPSLKTKIIIYGWQV